MMRDLSHKCGLGEKLVIESLSMTDSFYVTS